MFYQYNDIAGEKFKYIPYFKIIGFDPNDEIIFFKESLVNKIS